MPKLTASKAQLEGMIRNELNARFGSSEQVRVSIIGHEPDQLGINWRPHTINSGNVDYDDVIEALNLFVPRLQQKFDLVG